MVNIPSDGAGSVNSWKRRRILILLAIDGIGPTAHRQGILEKAVQLDRDSFRKGPQEAGEKTSAYYADMAMWKAKSNGWIAKSSNG